MDRGKVRGWLTGGMGDVVRGLVLEVFRDLSSRSAG